MSEKKKEKVFWKIFLLHVRQGCKKYSHNAESFLYFFLKKRLTNKIKLISTEKKETLRMLITEVISRATWRQIKVKINS